jgi:hypothetical protein
LCLDRLDVVLDLSETTSLPESSQLQIVRQEVKRVSEHVRFGACAIIASGNALFGMMRMFEATTEEYFDAICVFRSAAEAKAWLTARRSKD